MNNLEIIHTQGELNFLTLIDQEFGGWSILNPDLPAKNLTIIEKLVLLRKIGFKPLIDIRVAPNPKNPQLNILKIKQPSWFFSKQYYNDEKFEAAYKEYLLKYVTFLNTTTLPEIEKKVDMIFEIEKNLALVILHLFLLISLNFSKAVFFLYSIL